MHDLRIVQGNRAQRGVLRQGEAKLRKEIGWRVEGMHDLRIVQGYRAQRGVLR